MENLYFQGTRTSPMKLQIFTNHNENKFFYGMILHCKEKSNLVTNDAANQNEICLTVSFGYFFLHLLNRWH